MVKRKRETEIGVGQDSFLDVVSNIVGILIILVVLVGSQVKEGAVTEHPDTLAASVPSVDELLSPADAAAAQEERKLAAARVREMDEITAEMEKTRLLEENVHSQIREQATQRQRLEAETATANTDHEQMNTTLDDIRRHLDAMTAEDDVKKRELLKWNQLAIQRESEAQELRQRLVRYKKQLEGEDGGPTKIQHKMTPITRTVDTEEVWFIMKDGRIAYIPLRDLHRNYDRRLQTPTSAFLAGAPRTDVVGPLDGFSLHGHAQLKGGYVYARWVLETPPMTQVGETPQLALAPVSRFRNTLSHLDPVKHVLTIWVYPSAFSELQVIKREMYREGFSIAIRPLPEDTPIGASPDGQQSVAQ